MKKAIINYSLLSSGGSTHSHQQTQEHLELTILSSYVLVCVFVRVRQNVAHVKTRDKHTNTRTHTKAVVPKLDISG